MARKPSNFLLTVGLVLFITISLLIFNQDQKGDENRSPGTKTKKGSQHIVRDVKNETLGVCVYLFYSEKSN
jgi:hypothetical protein